MLFNNNIARNGEGVFSPLLNEAAVSDWTFPLILAWAVLLLVLWNLFRYSKALKWKSLLAAAVAITAVGLGAIGFLNSHVLQQHLPGSADLAVLPFFSHHEERGQIDQQGITLASLLSAQLRQSANHSLCVLPFESLPAMASLDSLTSVDRALRLMRQVGIEWLVTGIYRMSHDGLRLELALHRQGEERAAFTFHSLLRLQQPETALLSLSQEVLRSLRAEAASSGTCLELRLNESQRQLYYANYVNFLRGNNNLAGDLRQLMVQHPDHPLIAELTASSTLAELRRRKAAKHEWEDAASLMIPALKSIAISESLRTAPLVLQAEYYLQLQRWTEAERLLRQALAVDPTCTRIYLNLGQLHASRFQDLGFANDLQLYQHALQLNPLDMDAIVATAEALVVSQRGAEATELLEKYRDLSPNHLTLLFALGKLYIRQGDIVKTLQLYEHLLALAPQDANAFYDLGIAYYNHEDYDTATRFFERAIALSNHIDARLYLAYIYEQRQDMDQALTYLRERIRLSTGDEDYYAAEARRHLYRIMLDRGEIPEHLRPRESE